MSRLKGTISANHPVDGVLAARQAAMEAAHRAMEEHEEMSAAAAAGFDPEAAVGNAEGGRGGRAGGRGSGMPGDPMDIDGDEEWEGQGEVGKGGGAGGLQWPLPPGSSGAYGGGVLPRPLPLPAPGGVDFFAQAMAGRAGGVAAGDPGGGGAVRSGEFMLAGVDYQVPDFGNQSQEQVGAGAAARGTLGWVELTSTVHCTVAEAPSVPYLFWYRRGPCTAAQSLHPESGAYNVMHLTPL